MNKISSEIPIPANVRKIGKRESYDFGHMSVGDSIFFKGETTASKQMTAAYVYGRYNGKKFTGRTVDGGLRIWRVE